MDQRFAKIPELQAALSTVRLPPLRNAPMTERVAALVDHPAFQRLRRVRQLGPTHLVYPGAVHTRFEHSLGVFDMTTRYLTALLADPAANEVLEVADVEGIMVAALLHDVGHYPFAHSLEAVHVEGRDTPRHEDVAGDVILGKFRYLDGNAPSLGSMIEELFDVEASTVVSLITRKPRLQPTPALRLVGSILSSGIDADKADYLERDSVHMGVPYGRNYDRGRFLQSLCVHPDGDRIAITSKGRVSSEIFIFGRYTMFSEAYWHHTVRAVSAMVEHALADFREHNELDGDELVEFLLTHGDDAILERIAEMAGRESDANALLTPLTGFRRYPYKRVLTLSRVYDDKQSQTAYERIYHLDGSGRARLREHLCDVLGKWLGAKIDRFELLVDVPPRDKDRLEVPDVVTRIDGERVATSLADSSKVVQGIANDFIKVVKRIRVFVHPRVRSMIDQHAHRDHVRRVMLESILEFVPEGSFQQSFI